MVQMYYSGGLWLSLATNLGPLQRNAPPCQLDMRDIPACAAPLDQAGVLQDSQSPKVADGGAVME
jgi:hypothetical protein